MQHEEIAWVRHNIPPNARIVSDDDIWVALHDVKPCFPVRPVALERGNRSPGTERYSGAVNWQYIDYIVMSNGMLQAMQLNNGSTSTSRGPEAYMLYALQYHSSIVWQIKRGNVHLFIYKINH